MLLTNGRVYTLDAAGTVVDALVVRDGRIAFAGRRSDAVVPDREAVIDLGGRAVLPGLVDSHAHLMHLARKRLNLDVGGARSEDDAARRVAAAAAASAPGELIAGRGWDQNRWPGGGFPTRASLDRAAPGRAVALVRVDGHAIWASSAGLRAAGITRRTPDPAGGRIERDAAGEPTGILIDRAQELVRAVEPRPSEARFDRAVGDAIGECLAVGLTGLHEMGADLSALAAYRRLVVGALKLVADGALGSRGALLHAPYCDDPANAGLALLPPDELGRLTREGTARGFQVCVHAIGDRANTLVLDTFEAVLGEGRRPDHRLRVEHAQILADTDIPRFAALSVIPSMQPTHCTSDMPWAPARLGPERLRGAYAWRSLLDSGVVIAGGSDFPVESPNPFHGIYAAVTRRPLTGEDPAWQPEQRMSREEAVRAFTTWAAYAARQEAELGVLEVGKRADLVVCSDDVFTCPVERIKDITPHLVMVAGEVVLRREE